jgi:hypothetical protein
MHKILTALAVVALVALGTSVIASLILHSSIDRQSRQIGALDRAEAGDHKIIVALEKELRGKKAGHRAAAAARAEMNGTQPIGQPAFAVASPECLFTIRQDSLTAWNALAGIPFRSETSASGHCG